MQEKEKLNKKTRDAEEENQERKRNGIRAEEFKH
jgi:hypothetical protein